MFKLGDNCEEFGTALTNFPTERREPMKLASSVLRTALTLAVEAVRGRGNGITGVVLLCDHGRNR